MHRQALRCLPVRTVALVSVAVLSFPLRAQTLLEIGIIPYGEPVSATANAVDTMGHYAVGIFTYPNTTRAFIWGNYYGGTMDISCGETSGAYGLLFSHTAVGYSSFNGDPLPVPCEWVPGFCTRILGTNPTGLIRSDAYGIANSTTMGRVIVGAHTMSGIFGNYYIPWQRTLSGGIQTLPNFNYSGRAHAISSNGLVIVGDSGSVNVFGYSPVPCYWSGGVQTSLGLLTPTATMGQAMAVNADGSVIVGGGDTVPGYFSSGLMHAFRWQGSYTDLGLLPNAPAHGSSIARAVSEDGSVVLGHGTDNTGQHAFIWREDFGMIRLDTLLNFLGVNTSGWILKEANDISDNDRAICGGGIKEGLARAYVVRDLPRLCGPLVTGQAGPVINVCQGDNVILWTTGFWASSRPTIVWRKRVNHPPFPFDPLVEGETPWFSFIQSPNDEVCTILNAQPQDSGIYDCLISGGCDSVVLQSITVNVLTGPQMLVPVQLTQQVCKGATATFSVSVVPGTAGGPITYQWNKDLVPLTDGSSCGSTISGSQSSTLTITNCAGADAGVYGVTVSGPCGTLVSAGQLLVCVADVDDGSATGTCDGGVTIDDLIYFLTLIENGDPAADVDDGNQTGQPDCGVTIDDLIYYLPLFESGCDR